MFPSAHNKTCPGTEGERRVSPSGDNLVPKNDYLDNLQRSNTLPNMQENWWCATKTIQVTSLSIIPYDRKSKRWMKLVICLHDGKAGPW